MRLPVGLALSMVFLGAFAPACGQATDAEPDFSDDALYASRAFLWTTKSIPVCFEDATDANAIERGWVEDAVRSSWDAVSAIDFVGFGACTPDARGVRIRTEDVGPYTDGLGTNLDGKPGAMVLNFTFANWSPGCQKTREFCVRAGAVHEFGHALGFAHEQNRPDTPSWCTSEQGLRGDLVIGAWDVHSIMNYCNPKWTGDGRLSRMDIRGVRSVYGR
jgi:hypothetical protein